MNIQQWFFENVYSGEFVPVHKHLQIKNFSDVFIDFSIRGFESQPLFTVAPNECLTILNFSDTYMSKPIEQLSGNQIQFNGDDTSSTQFSVRILAYGKAK